LTRTLEDAGRGALQPPRTPPSAVLALLALSAAAFCFVTSETLPVGLLQVISSDLRVPEPSIGFLITVYALIVTALSVPLTQLTKHLPRRPLMCGLLGVFVISMSAAALAPGYWWLLAARVVTALAHAVFWSVVAVTAVSLFPPALRSRAVAVVSGGVSVGIVLGVPAGTWLGQQGGWRLPFFVLSGAGACVLGGAALLLPSYHPSGTHAGTGSAPDRRRYWLLMAATTALIAGSYTAYTYITPFLTRVAGLPHRDVAAVLLVAGIGSTLAVVATGLFFDRFPRVFAVGPVALLPVALLALYAFGHVTAAAVPLEVLASMSIGAFTITTQNRVLILAPGSTDLASAWLNGTFNAGVAGGSLLGGVLLPTLGVRSTTLAGGILATVALFLVVGSAGWRRLRP
jgi:DHA1 family inner membrane transport protein